MSGTAALVDDSGSSTAGNCDSIARFRDQPSETLEDRERAVVVAHVEAIEADGSGGDWRSRGEGFSNRAARRNLRRIVTVLNAADLADGKSDGRA
jgi:hypothetical protein